MRSRSVLGLAVGLAVLTSLPLMQPARPASAAPAGPELDPQPVGIVVLVDESGSLSDQAVQVEREATGLIAQSEISQSSQVAVVGFGGNTGLRNQAPVNVVCQPTRVDTGPDREYLANCVQDIHRRTDAEGPGTDYPRALSQGLALFDQMPDVTRKILFLLTDGKLDVSGDPSYGPDAETRNNAALGRMRDYLSQANRNGVQIWPLGFGNNIDRDQLNAFAAAGSQQACGPNAPRPQARVATDTTAVVSTLIEAFASARCAGRTDVSTASLPTGRSVSLPLQVPPIATDGSIAVLKRDSRVTVAYYDPAGHLMPKTGTRDESTFQVSGESSPVEVLRIRNPRPGGWKVVLTSGPGVPAQNVSAQVIWQGSVRASATLDPPAPDRGTVVSAHVVLATRLGALTDPTALLGLTVGATLTGDGFAAVNLALADDGKGPDSRAGDGEFTAQLTMPTTATGHYRLVGTVSGLGIATEQIPFDGDLAAAASGIRLQISRPAPRVTPGGTLSGTVQVTNSSGQPTRLRLRLAELDTGVLVTVSPPTQNVAASGSTEFAYQLRFDPATRLGAGRVRLQVVDDSAPTRVYGGGYVAFDVRTPPGFLERWWPLLAAAGAALLAVLAALGYRWRRRQQDRDVRGIVLLLFRDGRQLGYLAAPDRPAAEFRFLIRDEHGPQPRLDHATDGASGYRAARNGSGGVLVRMPDTLEITLQPGRPEPLKSGVSLGVRDSRHADRSGRTGAARRSRFTPKPTSGRAAEPPPDAPTPRIAPTRAGPSSPSPTTFDDLL
ncbi:MAG TPA: vWA domain-containing protein [Mycobacteriales bacterium]|nr:vWA domain-containing protein [Mycobacteriales bacterium]